MEHQANVQQAVPFFGVGNIEASLLITSASALR